MRAVGIERFGGPQVLEVLDLPVPELRRGEVLVKVLFAGVNYIDVYMRRGDQGPSPGGLAMPRVLGREGAGEVVKTGAGVSNLTAGDRVAWCVTAGAYAELCAVPAWRLWPVPADVPLDVACALQLQGATAHFLATSTFPLRQNDVALVHSGAGGVGQLLIQLAKLCGARVLATVGDGAKAPVAASRGADAVVVRSTQDFLETAMTATEGRGCHVVYDAIGRDTLEKSIAACRRRGLVVLYGGASGAVEALNPLALAEAGSIYFTRPHLADFMQDAAEVQARSSEMADLWRTGRLAVEIGRVLPLDGARAAHEALESRTLTSKILLRPVA